MGAGNSSYVLDTNIVIDLLKGKAEIAEEIENAREVFLPVFALGELYFGAENSQRPTDHKSLVDRVLEFVTVLHAGHRTAFFYGQIKSRLKKEGRPIPENDVWIAALAMEHGLPLVTRDTHFSRISGLEIVEW